MFKGKYDESIFYQIVHYYNGKIVDKNELENYFDVLNDNSFQLRPSYINDETIYKTKQLLNVLRFLSIQDDDIINNFDYYNDLFKNQIMYFQEFFCFQCPHLCFSLNSKAFAPPPKSPSLAWL